MLFIILFALSRKTPARPRGTFFGTFLLFYGLFRFTIEFIRQPMPKLAIFWEPIGSLWGKRFPFRLWLRALFFLYMRGKRRNPRWAFLILR